LCIIFYFIFVTGVASHLFITSACVAYKGRQMTQSSCNISRTFPLTWQD